MVDTLTTEYLCEVINQQTDRFLDANFEAVSSYNSDRLTEREKYLMGYAARLAGLDLMDACEDLAAASFRDAPNRSIISIDIAEASLKSHTVGAAKHPKTKIIETYDLVELYEAAKLRRAIQKAQNDLQARP